MTEHPDDICGYEYCQECCDHFDHDGHCCLSCGADVHDMLRDEAVWLHDSMEDGE